MAEPQTGMPKPDLRRMLALAKKEPVSCAVGQGPDAAFGLMMLDKIKQPRAVEKALTAAVPDAKNTRYGTAAVDPDEDPKLVKLVLNRAVSGMGRRLLKTLKGTGISKIEIALEDGTVVEKLEGEEDEEEQGGEEAEDATAQGSTRGAAQPSATPGPDRAALEHRLAGLIPRVQQLGASHPQQRELIQLAGQANAGLKANDLDGAAGAIDQLAAKLDAPAGGDGVAVRLAKGLLLWNGTRGYVDQQVKKLAQAILEQSAGEVDFDDIKANIGRIDAVLERLDDRLSDKLNALRATTDPAEKAKISAEARQVVSEYQGYVAADPMMADIDDNGFIPLDVRAKVTAALDAVLRTI